VNAAGVEKEQLLDKEPFDKERKTIMRRAAVLPRLEMFCAVLMYSIAGDMKKRTNDTVSHSYDALF